MTVCVRQDHYPLHLHPEEFEPRLHHATVETPCKQRREPRVATKRGPNKPLLGVALRELEQRAFALSRTIATLEHERGLVLADLAALKRERAR